MAYHEEAASVVTEAIDEYLLMAEYGINFRKASGGILGYPTALLLLSVIDILGSYAVASKEHFLVLSQPCFGLQLTVAQIKRIEHWYRNLLAHNGFIAPGTVLRPDDDGEPFTLDSHGEPTVLRVKPLFRAVKLAWERFDKSLLDATRHMKPSHVVTAPVDLRGSPASEIAASSGAYVDPKCFVRKM
jgi:hypothetical protein